MEFVGPPNFLTLILDDGTQVPWDPEWTMDLTQVDMVQFPAHFRAKIAPVLLKNFGIIVPAEQVRDIPVAFNAIR